jgi:hypothetical protein
MRRRILYLGWVNFGNLGDEACKDLFIEKLRAAAWGRCEPEVVSIYPCSLSERDLHRLRVDLVVLGGGSTLGLPYVGPLIIAQRHGIPTVVWGSGIDGLPDQILAALRSGVSPNVSEIYSDEAYHVRAAVSGCSAVGVRGPHTLDLLRLIQCQPHDLDVCGDPGLLLREGPGGEGGPAEAGRPAPREPLTPEWFEADCEVVGVNWGTTRNRLYGGDEERPAALLAQALDHMLPEFRVLLYAVWPEDLPALRALASRLGRRDRVLYHDKVYPAPVLCSLLKKCSFTINLKLHGSVFSAAAGRPFLCLAYSSKSYDFAASVGCDDLVIRVDEPHLPELVTKACRAIRTEMARYEATLKTARRTYVERLTALARRCVDLVA